MASTMLKTRGYHLPSFPETIPTGPQKVRAFLRTCIFFKDISPFPPQKKLVLDLSVVIINGYSVQELHTGVGESEHAQQNVNNLQVGDGR